MQTQTVKGVATTIRTERAIESTLVNTIIQYHSTEVVSFNNHLIILNTGGWKTMTTKTRMNQASNQFRLGYYVYQSNFEWYVDYKGETYKFEESELTLTR